MCAIGNDVRPWNLYKKLLLFFLSSLQWSDFGVTYTRYILRLSSSFFISSLFFPLKSKLRLEILQLTQSVFRPLLNITNLITYNRGVCFFSSLYKGFYLKDCLIAANVFFLLFFLNIYIYKPHILYTSTYYTYTLFSQHYSNFFY